MPTPPQHNEIEICLFGPGFGECVLFHFGDNRWAIIDSCVNNNSQRPAALEYLESISVAPKQVEFILATHWHNDHIGGMSELVSACFNAKFACPMGMDKDQFIKFILTYNKATVIDNSVSEIYNTFRTLRETDRDWTFAVANLPLFVSRSPNGGVQTAITALSPVNDAINNFIAFIGLMNRRDGKMLVRVPAPDSNMLSTATWIQIANTIVLLGADLEEDGNQRRGWSAVPRLSG